MEKQKDVIEKYIHQYNKITKGKTFDFFLDQLFQIS
jgi:hypothetical protein